MIFYMVVMCIPDLHKLRHGSVSVIIWTMISYRDRVVGRSYDCSCLGIFIFVSGRVSLPVDYDTCDSASLRILYTVSLYIRMNR